MARTVAITGKADDGALSARRTTATRGDTAGDRPGRRGTMRGREEVSAPARETRRPARATEESGRTGGGGRGFGAWKQTVKNSKSDINNLQVKDQTVVVAFLDDEPFDNVLRHWCQIQTESGTSARVPRNCIGEECPLCERGDEPKPFLLFNVVNMESPTSVLLWEAGKEIAKRVEKRYDDLAAIKKGPLKLNSPGVYFEVSRTKKDNGFYEYSVDRLREADLVEEWELEPLTEDDRAALEAKSYDSSIIKYNTVEELEEFAKTLED